MKKIFTLIPGNLLLPNKQTAGCKKGYRRLVWLLLPALLLVTAATNKLYADVTLTSTAVPAGDMNQGTSNNVIHITQMQVTTTAVTVNNVQFTLAGTYDNNDLATVLVYFNSTAPTFAGSSFLGSAVATFAAPHSYSINLSRAMAAGSTGYFIFVTNVTSDATDNHTVFINGATSPVLFGFTTAPVVINNQSNASGPQTIQAADITLVSSAVPAGDMNQGTNNNLVYVAQMTVATEPVTVNNVLFTLAGTYDNNDLETVLVYFNPTAPTFAGSSFLGSAVATFAAPHSYSINISRAMAVGSTGYFLILTNVAVNATDNNTVLINGATNPVVFGFTTAPNITNNQTNASAAQTIQAADITLVSSAVPAGDMNQGTNNNLLYVAQMSVATEPVTVNNVQFTLAGTFDNNDLETVLVYFNPTAPTFAGSSFLGSAVATFAAPHTYSINVSRAMAVGSTGYFLVLVNVAADATDNHTVLINGATNPVVFGFTTAPNIINNQTNASAAQTIQAADITLVSSAVPAGDMNQGTNNNLVYVAQMTVATEPVTVNNVQFTLSGTHDANDLETVLVYFNSTAPTFAGSSFLGSAVATFAAPHTYSINISRAMAVGSTGYFLILVNVNSAATDNRTVLVNGATNPVVFGFTTAPNVTNNQTNASGAQTIQAGDITLVSSPVAAGDINQGTSNNLVYVTQMTVATEPVTVNNILFTLAGTHDGNDLVTALVYFNSTAPTFAGSSFLGSADAAFAAPHTNVINISRAMAAGSTGYFLILVNVNSAATDNNTVLVNGAANPVVFGFTTTPNVSNNQTNASGTQTIQASDITLVSSAVPAGDINQGTNNNLIYVTQMTVATEPVTVNNVQFTLSGTHDANDLETVLVYFNSTAPTFAGSSFLGSAAATFAAPHTYSVNISRAMAVGSTGYFLILTNVAANATDNNTILVNGATNPVVFGFTTSPNISNNQSNASGTQTIQASDITLSTSPVATNTFPAGTNNNIVYIAQMSVATEPVTVNNLQFTLAGTHDGNDLETVLIYFNGANPTFSGSTFLGSAVATFAAPHTYNINVSRAMAVGSTGYFLILVNVATTATAGNTVLINGASNPVIFSFSTSPNIINNQTDNGGLHTLPVNFISVNAIGKNAGVEVEWKVAAELNVAQYIVQKSGDGNSFTAIGTVAARGGSNATASYRFFDANPSAGNHFYRIQVLNIDGKMEYSPVVKINTASGNPGMSIHPNPVLQANRLNLSLQYLKAGTYRVSLFNSDGQRVALKEINHAGGNSTQAFQLPALAAGTYRIELRGSNQRFIQSVIVE